MLGYDLTPTEDPLLDGVDSVRHTCRARATAAQRKACWALIGTAVVGTGIGLTLSHSWAPRTPVLLSAVAPSAGACSTLMWNQCDGKAFSGEKCCPDAAKCVARSKEFSQCVPDCLNLPWDPCGGTDFKGATCCPTGSSCVVRSDAFSQCVPAQPVDMELDSAPGGCATPPWTQCGGEGYKGDTCCPDGYSCVVRTAEFSQCATTPKKE